MKVFIAEDSEVVCERLTTLLSDLPETEIIGQAQDVPRSIESIRKLHPDVVILDIRMPGGSGMDVLEDIKTINTAPIVIILTNFPYPQYRKKCMVLGAEYFFDKSTEFEKVTEVLETLIQNPHT